MAVNRGLYKQSLGKYFTPKWQCPSCESGQLELIKESLHYDHTKESSEALRVQDDAWDPSWVKYRFSALLKCNNRICNEVCTVGGMGEVDIVFGEEGDEEYESFSPKYISPSPPIFKIPSECPTEVESELRQAFVASWGDYSSATNHIRISVEKLLDFLKEPKTKVSKRGKRYKLTLHERIGALAARNKSLGESLLAIKWLGNVGSHSNNITRDDVFDAFDILEHAFEKLFVKHTELVENLIKKINKNMGPIKKKKRH